MRLATRRLSKLLILFKLIGPSSAISAVKALPTVQEARLLSALCRGDGKILHVRTVGSTRKPNLTAETVARKPPGARGNPTPQGSHLLSALSHVKP